MEITGIDYWEESSEPGADASGRGRGRMSWGKEGEPDKHRLLSFQHLSLERRTREAAFPVRQDQKIKTGAIFGPGEVGELKSVDGRPRSPGKVPELTS